MVEDAARRAANLALEKVESLDKTGAQRLIEHGDEFETAIAELVVAKTRELSLSNQFANEEVPSNYGYLSGYKKPKGMTEQTNLLRQLFPGIGFADEQLATRDLPKGAEGYFAIPRWETLAPTYGEAVQKVLDMIKKTRNGKLYNYCEGKLGPQYLRQHAKTSKAFQVLGDQQKGYDILVVPCQFGLRHRGRSVRRAREVMIASEFALGAFANGIMILTHPERLQHDNDLWIDGGGDEFSPDAGGRFDFAPSFVFDGGRVRFDAFWVLYALDLYGSPSGFCPQK